jgi:hypothetical protein
VTASLRSRALAAAIDTAVVVSLVESSRLLFNVASTRTVALWSTALFASMGVAWVCAFPVSLIVCALPSPPDGVRRALRWALALGALAALAAGLPMAFALCVLAARRASSSAEGAGFTRALAAVFAALFAVASLASSHVLRAHLSHDTLVIARPLRWLASRAPAPTLVTLAAARPAIDPAPRHELTLVFELRALAPELAMSMDSAQLIARNGALFVDARAATEGRSALSSWDRRFSAAGPTRYVRCDDGRPLEPCALAALSSPEPLVLSVQTAQRNPALIDRQLATILRAAHARTPLSRALIAMTSEREPSNSWLDDRNTRAVVVLSARGIARGLVRGAVRVDEVASALDAIAAGVDDPLLALAQRRAPWFDRTVVLSATRGAVALRSAHSARYSLVVAPRQWGVALFDHELDPNERVNRADVLRSVVHSMGALMGAAL